MYRLQFHFHPDSPRLAFYRTNTKLVNQLKKTIYGKTSYHILKIFLDGFILCFKLSFPYQLFSHSALPLYSGQSTNLHLLLHNYFLLFFMFSTIITIFSNHRLQEHPLGILFSCRNVSFLSILKDLLKCLPLHPKVFLAE